MVDTALGRCRGRPGVFVGLARGWLRCRGAEEQGGLRGGELGELEVGDGLGSDLSVDGTHGRRVPAGLGLLLGVVQAREGADVV